MGREYYSLAHNRSLSLCYEFIIMAIIKLGQELAKRGDFTYKR